MCPFLHTGVINSESPVAVEFGHKVQFMSPDVGEEGEGGPKLGHAERICLLGYASNKVALNSANNSRPNHRFRKLDSPILVPE